MRAARLRRRAQDDSKHHDRWMVSYADLITLLFAFFVVLYASSSVNSTKYEQLKVSMGAAFNAQSDPKKAVSKANELIAKGALPSVDEPTTARTAAALDLAPDTELDPHQTILLLTDKVDKLSQEQKALKISLDHTQGLRR